MEARIAEKDGLTSVYSALVKKDVPIDYGGYFRDKSTGATYRVTSRLDEKQAPEMSTYDVKFLTAERKELPI